MRKIIEKFRLDEWDNKRRLGEALREGETIEEF
jgi:hypothetical protein